MHCTADNFLHIYRYIYINIYNIYFYCIHAREETTKNAEEIYCKGWRCNKQPRIYCARQNAPRYNYVRILHTYIVIHESIFEIFK